MIKVTGCFSCDIVSFTSDMVLPWFLMKQNEFYMWWDKIFPVKMIFICDKVCFTSGRMSFTCDRMSFYLWRRVFTHDRVCLPVTGCVLPVTEWILPVTRWDPPPGRAPVDFAVDYTQWSDDWGRGCSPWVVSPVTLVSPPTTGLHDKACSTINRGVHNQCTD